MKSACAHATVQYLPYVTVNCLHITSSHCLLSVSCYCEALRAHLEMRFHTSLHCYYYSFLENIGLKRLTNKQSNVQGRCVAGII